jgi:site-specific DNA recombinase
MAIQQREIEPERIMPILERTAYWIQELRSEAGGEALAALVDRVDLARDGFRVTLRLPISPSDPSDTLTLAQFVPLTMRKRGVELRLVIPNEPPSAAKADMVLLRTIARAHKWFDQLLSGEVKSLASIATREGLNYRFVGKVIRLAFLAPEIVEAIAEGRQPAELSTELLTKRIRLPLAWNDQKRLLNIN